MYLSKHKTLKHYLGALFLMLIVTSCKGQTQTNVERNVDGGCQDCKALLDYKMLNITPKSVDTLPGFHENEPKLKITGTAFKKDGKHPLKMLYSTFITQTEMEFTNLVTNL